MTAYRIVDFPDPDSPTRPTTSSGWRRRLTSRSTGATRPPTAKPRLRSWISRGAGSGVAIPRAQVESIAKALAEQIEADDRERDRERGTEERPVGRGEVLLGVLDHHAPIGGGRLGAQAEIAQP